VAVLIWASVMAVGHFKCVWRQEVAAGWSCVCKCALCGTGADIVVLCVGSENRARDVLLTFSDSGAG